MLKPAPHSKKSEYQRPSTVTSVLLGKLARAYTETEPRSLGVYHSSLTWPPVSCRERAWEPARSAQSGSALSWAAAADESAPAKSSASSGLFFISFIYDSP